MTRVHPTMEAVARAICEETTNDVFDWEDYLPEASAALKALTRAEERYLPVSIGCFLLELADGLLSAPTAEDVLREHRLGVLDLDYGVYRCAASGCEWAGKSIDHPTHVVAELETEGLLADA